MKHKGLYIATIIFFLLVNTTYYWEGKMGMFAMVTFLLLILYYLVLTILLLGQTFFAIREKLKNRTRLFLIGIMTTVLGLSFIYPGGLINFDKLESVSVFIAQREGVANYMTTLKLRADQTFIERNVCFGVSETTGTYNIKGDTIYFEKVSLGRHENKFYKFAVIKKRETKSEKYLGDLVRYKDYSDTTGIALWIIKNELTK
ncbi:MAG: hypothetical protein MUC97_14430 [Bernardetiaceae bacterium]|nr:hypothetical protein [Bernardetiaceae bacterium]